jgi:3-oxoacyl-[acyl-carrier protein] reductase
VVLGRNSAELASLTQRIAELPTRLTVAPVDLADAHETVRTCREQLERGAIPDIVINNAGVIERAPVEALTLDSWERQLAVNLRAPYLITREVLPIMRTRRQGRIIHIGSISSTLGTARASAYCASKWGIVGFMKSLAEELRDTGVTTLAILPGSVDTDMLKGSGFPPRIDADDVARTIVHYALDASAAGHNGSVIEMFGV